MNNLIDRIYDANQITTTDSKKLVLRSLTNALTAATCSSLMVYIGQRNRGELDPSTERTLDERNEIDATERGLELEAEHKEEIGYNVDMPALKIAQICNGIRHWSYRELDSYVDLAPMHMKPLLQTQPRTTDGRINWDQPMSAADYMDARVRSASKVNPNEVEMLARRKSEIDAAEDAQHADDATYEVERVNRRRVMIAAAMKSAALKQQARLATIKPDVLAELATMAGLHDVPLTQQNEVTGMVTPAYQPDAFVALPLSMQVRIAENMLRQFNREYERLLPISLRDMSVAGDVDMVEHLVRTVNRWINESEHQARLDSQRIAA